MLIVLHPDVTSQAQATIEARVRELGFTPHAISGAGRTAIGITAYCNQCTPAKGTVVVDNIVFEK